jgi:hypothetical protein
VQIIVSANGEQIAVGQLEKTIPVQFSPGAGLNVGLDIGSPIDFTYAALRVHRQDAPGNL